jgi:hypothetical protein
MSEIPEERDKRRSDQRSEHRRGYGRDGQKKKYPNDVFHVPVSRIDSIMTGGSPAGDIVTVIRR